MKGRKRLFLLLIAAITGFIASIYLSRLYYDLRGGLAGFKSMCDLGRSMSCQSVALSSYADFVPGLPKSSVTAGWFLALALLSLLARNDTWRKESLRVSAAMYAVGLVFTVYLLFVMIAVLKTFCLFCLVIDAVNLTGLLTCLSLLGGDWRGKLDGKKVQSAAILTVCSVFLMVVLLQPSSGAKDEEGTSAVQIDAAVRDTLANPVMPLNISPEDTVMGPSNAPITIVEYSDFQCPYCKRGAMVLHSVMGRFPTQVRVVFKNFPLDQKCNRKVTHAMHEYACELARAGICASRMGRFEPVYESFFERQEGVRSEVIDEVAQAHGLEASKLRDCMNEAAVAKQLERHVEEGIQLQIEATPTFYINGHKMEGGHALEIWTRVIESLLAK